MLALYYHLQHQEFQEDIKYWLSLSEKYGGPILELGCGTGRVTLPLGKTGLQIVAIDNDPDMISVFKEQPLSDLPNISLIEGDFFNYQFQQLFPLVVLPCNTYSLFSQKDRVSLATIIFDLLSPKGCFSFSVPNPHVLKSLQDQSQPEIEITFEHPISKNPVVVSSGWVKLNNQIKIDWIYDHLLPNGEIERKGVSLLHQIETVDKYIEELHGLGFNTKIYGAYNKSPYEKESEVLLIEATKP